MDFETGLESFKRSRQRLKKRNRITPCEEVVSAKFFSSDAWNKKDGIPNTPRRKNVSGKVSVV